MDLLSHLNERQLAAVTLPNQSALILAGAGSGKTRVLTTRIAWLIQTGQVSPQGILAVTFTNKAAKEMLTRLSAMLPINTRGMWIGTFHGLCNRMLRAHYRDAGLPSTFQILDSADQLGAIKRLLKANNVDDERYPPRNLQLFINNAKEAGLRANAVEVNDDYNRKFVELYALYDAQCNREGVVDFAELLLRCYELLDRNEILREHYQSRFRHILVDEFQDTNRLQYAWLKQLAAAGQQKGNAVFAVGDDDQCVVAGTEITMGDGSVKPVDQIRVGNVVRSCTGGGKMASSRVWKVHYRTEQTRLVTIRTQKGKTLTTTPEHVHFAGYAVGHMPARFFLYMMMKPDVGYRLAVAGHRRARHNKYLPPGFRYRARKEGGEQIWIIGTYENAVEAHEQLAVMSLKYGLPMRAFTAGRARKGKAAVPREFYELNTERSAKWLLADRGLSFEHPDDRRRPSFGDEGDVIVSMCSDSRRGRPDHRVYARTCNEESMQRVVQAGFSMKPVVEGKGGWAAKFWRRDYADAIADASRLRAILGGRVIQRARIGKGYLPLVQAQYVRAGMAVADASGRYDLVREVELHDPESRTLYDLDIEDSHNFIANGICTHNSIYAFRGANVGNMADFEREFRVQNLIKLEQNYRSVGHILNAANALIANNERRLGKNLWTEAGEGEPVRVYEAQSDGYEAAWLVEEVKSLIAEGHARSEIAVLYRSNAQSRVIEHALFNATVPYRVYGGLRFFERAEIKHALAYMRLIENPADDTAFLRVVNFPPRGIGARTLEQLGDAARDARQSLYTAASTVTGRAGSSLGAFVQLIDTLRSQTEELPLSDIVDAVIQKSGLIAHYQSEKEGQERIENLNELVNAAAAFVMEEGYDANTPSVGAANEGDSDASILSPLAAFLSHASLEAGDNQAEAGQDALQLMTVHSAKGLEFHAVFITGLEEGLFPHENSMNEAGGPEEERRLMYVAITRARQRLYISFAQTRLLHGQTRYGIRSRFIDELPEGAVKWLTPRVRAGARFGNWRDSGFAPAPAPVMRSQPSHGFRIGQSVRHTRFGEGVIVNLEGSGDDARAQVNFGPQGMKWLQLAVAKLTT
jgi:DNA helicase-2/ATP-dependent DNA helicase PcrA